MTLRACFPYNFKRFLEYNKDRQEFQGLLGNIVDTVNSYCSRAINLTLQPQADDIGIGVFRDDLNHFDGCIGELQMNRTDLILQMFPYPMDVPSVSQGNVWYETSLKFVSMYHKTELGGSSQVLESFQAFSPTVWSFCIGFCLLMTIILTLEQIISRFTCKFIKINFGNYLYQVIVHCTRFGSMNDGGLSRRLLFIAASIHALLIVHYFNTMIKTELVVVKDPLVFESYQDIIERQAIPFFINGMSYDTLFKSESAKAYRKRLWNYAIKSYPVEQLYVDMSPLFFLLLGVSLIKLQAIVVLDEPLIPLVVTSGCSLAGRDVARIPMLVKLLQDPERVKRLMNMVGIEKDEQDKVIKYSTLNDLSVDSTPELLIHVSRDSNELPYLQGILYTSHSDKLKKVLEQASKKAIESGLAGFTMKNLKYVDIFAKHALIDQLLGKSMASRAGAVENCRSESVVMPSIEFHAITNDNLKSLFILIAVIYSLLLMLLVVEMIFRRLVHDKNVIRTSRKNLLICHVTHDEPPTLRVNGRPVSAAFFISGATQSTSSGRSISSQR